MQLKIKIVNTICAHIPDSHIGVVEERAAEAGDVREAAEVGRSRSISTRYPACRSPKVQHHNSGGSEADP
jgi:hypothetical protein